MVDGVAGGATPPTQDAFKPNIERPTTEESQRERGPGDNGKQSENAYEVKKTGGEHAGPINY